MAKHDPTPTEMRRLAQERLGLKPQTTSSLFNNRSYASSTEAPRDHVLSCRVDSLTATRVANYGNANNLSLSESVRTLIYRGLDAEEAIAE